MRQNARTLIQFSILYLALATMGIGPLFLWGGTHEAIFGIAMVVAVALIPGTAVILTFLQSKGARESEAAPVMLQPAAKAVAPTRARFEFAFAAWNGIESGEAVHRLSRRLHALGMDHRYQDGQILVRDGATRWSVAPVKGALRIVGWVEAPDAETRELIARAVEEFLINELGIRLEQIAA